MHAMHPKEPVWVEPPSLLSRALILFALLGVMLVLVQISQEHRESDPVAKVSLLPD